jgi:sigma-B regulation protein RsbU (phosphoserine phosphatase)
VAEAAEVGADEALDAFYAALLDDDAEALYDRAPCGYVSTTPDGTIVKVNATFLALTGYERGDLVGRRRFADLLSGGGRIDHETHLAPMLRAEGLAREIALDVVRGDGVRLPVLLNAVLERDAAGSPVVVRVAVFDATHRREYERELLRAKERAEASEARARLLARTLQASLVPPAPPVVPGLDVTATYRPAGDGSEVGGDLYDVFELADGDWVVAVGDVRGKGAEAAVVASLARSTIRAAAVHQTSPAALLEAVHRVLLQHDGDRFCTAVAIRLRRGGGGTWEATVAVGGHPLPLLARPGQPPVEVGRPGTLLGAIPEVRLHDVLVPLAPGDLLVACTDGVTEAPLGDGTFFGEGPLAEAVARLAAGAGPVAEALTAEVLAAQGGDARDDVVVVAVRAPLVP